MEHKIILPLFVVLPRKTKDDRKLWLTLNNYRNWQFHVSNQAKHIFEEKILNQVIYLNSMKNIELEYTVFRPDKRKFDLMNVGAVVDKFFQDCLSNLGKIPDDNILYVKKVSFIYGGYDKDNGRVEAIIREV